MPPKLRYIAAAVIASLSFMAPAEEKIEPPPAAESPSLTPDLLYQFLLAEIAANRGNLPASAGAYIELAKSTRDPRIARRATEVAFYAHQLETALEAARIWVAVEPKSLEAWQTLWALLAATDRTEELSKLLAQTLASAGAGAGAAILNLGRLAVRYPDKQAAFSLVTQVTAPYESLPETHLIRAQAAYAARNEEQALISINRALAIKPDWEIAVLFKAQLQSADLAKTLATLADFTGHYPKARDAKLAYARALVDAKRYKEARRVFAELLEGKQDNPELLYSVGLLSLQLGDLVEGERALKRLLATDFADLDSVRYYLGHGAEQGSDAAKAVGYFDAVSTRSGHYVSAQVRAANLLRQQGRIDEARHHLQQAAVAAPKDRIALVVAESQLLLELHKYEDAYRVLESALQEQPEDTTLLYESALLAEKLGRFDVLEGNLNKLIKLKPDDAQAYNALGYSLADRSIRLEEARTLIEKALSLAPQDPFILDSRGWVAFRSGDTAEAADFLRKALAISADPEVAAHLGEVLWVQGLREEARKTWDEALKAHPDNDALVATIKRLQP